MNQTAEIMRGFAARESAKRQAAQCDCGDPLCPVCGEPPYDTPSLDPPWWAYR